MLLGLSEPTSGRAEVVGFDPTRDPLEVKRRVGYLPDDVGFYGELSGRQNMRYTAALNGLDHRQADERIGLSCSSRSAWPTPPSGQVDQYSRGMRQRLGLADALVKDPVDRDPRRADRLDRPGRRGRRPGPDRARLPASNGVTVLLSSHLLHQVHQVCDRVAIFNPGRILAQGKMSELAEALAGDQLELEVGVDGPADQVEAALRGGAAGSPASNATRTIRTLWRVSGPQSIRDHLASDLAARGFSIRHLRRVGDELDEIYLRYFSRDEGDRDHAA